MQVVHDNKLLKLIKIIPTTIVLIFTCITLLGVINHNRSQLAADLKSLQQNFISAEKEKIKAQVIQLLEQIAVEQENTEAMLKKDIKDHIYQAHAIATTIYSQNKEKPEAVVTKLITDALRNIRFNEGRGYFFIYKTQGDNVMHPLFPAFEGTDKGDLQDSRGNYIVRDLGALAKTHGESYYRWWFVKPGDKSQEYEKIGFGKHFAPYDWHIGTGEYVVDVENDIKQRLIERISQVSYDRNDHFFLLNYDGDVLSHYHNEMLSRNVLHGSDQQLKTLGMSIIATAQQGEGYLNYMTKAREDDITFSEKISFISGFPKWQWVIGTGFFKNETEQYLAQRRQRISEQHQQQFYMLLAVSLAFAVFFIALSLMLSRYLTNRFSAYEGRINADFEELNSLRVKSQHEALHDTLTKLPNRTLLEQNIKRGISLSKAQNKQLAVVFLDLDDFKKTNDLHGHSVGDGLLEAVSEQFMALLEDNDSVARFGGDEFIFCLPELDDIATAQRKVAAIQAVFAQQFNIKGRALHSTCSAGIAMYPSDGQRPEELISKADIVLYKSKAREKGCSLFFSDTINEQVKRDFLLEGELRLALSNHEFTMVYQPQIAVQSQQISGVEALIRWHSKVLGFVPPDEFISKAEDIGIINEIGRFVIEQSIADIAILNSQRTDKIQLSINISPKQLLDPQFTQHLLATVEAAAVLPHFITLEITENVVISDFNKVGSVIDNLRYCGFKLSLDDFGTGYSSLSYLNNLPMTEIKIDRAFIDKFLVNTQSESLVKTIIAIGQCYDLTVVAEGVETKEQFERLKMYDCHVIQGYFFDRPLLIDLLIEKYQAPHDNALPVLPSN